MNRVNEEEGIRISSDCIKRHTTHNIWRWKYFQRKTCVRRYVSPPPSVCPTRLPFCKSTKPYLWFLIKTFLIGTFLTLTENSVRIYYSVFSDVKWYLFFAKWKKYVLLIMHLQMMMWWDFSHFKRRFDVKKHYCWFNEKKWTKQKEYFPNQGTDFTK